MNQENSVKEIKKGVFCCKNCGKIPLMTIINDDIPRIHYLCNFCLKDITLDIKEFLKFSMQEENKIQVCSRTSNHKKATEAKHFCIQCHKWYCNDCLNVHNEFSGDHVISPSEIKIDTKCSKHTNKDIEFYCDDCKCNLCLLCHDEDHKNHKIIILKNVATNPKFRDIEEDIFKAQEKIRQYNKSLKVGIIDSIQKEIKELTFQMEKIENAYKENNSINEQILQIVEILISNFNITSKCPNYQIMMNLYNNSTFNLKKFEFPENIQKKEAQKILINYYEEDFLIPKKKSDLSDIICQSTLSEDSSIKSLLLFNKNKLACCSSGSDIKIYNTLNNTCELVLKGHTEGVLYVSQYDKNILLSCSKDKTIIIWELSDNNYSILGTLQGHSSAVTKVINLVGGNIASCSSDKTIKVWENSSSFSCIATLKSVNEKTNIDSFIQISNGKLVSCSCCNDTVSFYDLLTFKLVYIMEKISSSTSSNSLLEIENNKIAICGYKALTIIDGDEYTIQMSVSVPDGGNLRSVAFWKKNTLIAGGYCHLCQIDLLNGNCVAKKEKAHNNLINCVVINNNEIITCSDDKTIKKWKF